MQQITCNAFLGGTHTVPLEKLVFRPAVYGIITYDGKMMVITNRRTGKLWPPGGGVDLGERMENALKREVREETGIEIAVDRFEGFEEKFFYYRKTTTSGSGPKKGSTSVANMTSIMYQPGRCETNRRYMMTRRLKKLAHSLYECKYHVVFCPKYRYKILQDEVAKYVTQQIYRLSSQKDGIEVMEVNVQSDHVHLVVSIPPKYAVSKYMGFLKGKLALQLFDRYPQLRRRYWGQHVWSRGYCVSTVGLDEERIKKYVRWQNRKDEEADAIQGRLFD